ncbi:MAG: helix-turn-helix domain-containing protein [Chitinivibrionales bacterium]|nr:helix-turn-helix domain-containing protein [Chitinivibrionales bacterium]MBD3397336.1 helix-turn-helix domain-containing protein [Chitinivibrionales bacterium]
MLEWPARKFRVHVVSGKDADARRPIEDTESYREMEVNRAGNLLQGARLKAGMSQKGLADAVGIRQTMVSEFGNGRRPTTKKMAKPLAGALKTKPTRLV